MAIFSGTYEHNLDAKNRLFVPSDFRTQFEGKLMLRLNITGEYLHIDCFLEDEFESVVAREVEKEMEQRALLPAEMRPTDDPEAMARSFARPVAVDNGGRICLSAKLLERAGITKESTFVGKGSYFEIWNPDNYDAFNDEMYEMRLARARAEKAQQLKYYEYMSKGYFFDLKNTGVE